MDSLKCQTSTVTPAEPGDFPGWLMCSSAQSREITRLALPISNQVSSVPASTMTQSAIWPTKNF